MVQVPKKFQLFITVFELTTGPGRSPLLLGTSTKKLKKLRISDD